MQFIIIDLEWNQPLSYYSQVYREVGDRLLFEMIQIGAVRLNDRFEMVDSISIPIKPTHYVKIHPRIRRMTQLGAEELADAPTFLPAMRQFVEWCGEDYTLLTWGCDDVSVLKQNMDFFGCTEKIPPLCDIQHLFSDVHHCKDRKGLKAAMDMLEIEPDEDRAFHNALHDAYYTALVFAKLPDPAAVLKYPQTPKKLIHQERVNRARGKSESFPNAQAALESDQAAKPRCPICGRETVLEEGGYVKQTAGKYLGLSKCAHHGDMLSRVRLQRGDDGNCLMSVSVLKATGSNRAYVHTKRLQMAEKEARYLAEHGTLPDADRELDAGERSNMPFDD